MELKKLKEKLRKKFPNRKHQFRNLIDEKGRKNKEMKIIGITGSYGKTTTAIIIHNYLKMLGYKSILYSSSLVDSPASYKSKHDAFEIALDSEETLLRVIEEAEVYNADFLVLEINETTIEKGIVNDVPFAVKVLTNLNSKHNLELYTEEQYVAIKKSFFENTDDTCKCIFGFQNYSKQLYDELKVINNSEKYFLSSGYVAEKYGLNKMDLFAELMFLESDLDGLRMDFRLNNCEYNLNTSLVMPYNSLNILCAIVVLQVLNLFDVNKFKNYVFELRIPGRLELIKIKNRYILIDLNLPTTLEALKKLKDDREIFGINVVVGSIGLGFDTWDNCFKTEKYIEQHKQNKKFAMEVLVKNADKVYLTENDNAGQNVIDICLELKEYINNRIESEIIEDRYSAIKKAILDSHEGDVIFISGRGNRRIMCTSNKKMKFIRDIDMVNKVLKEIEWK